MKVGEVGDVVVGAGRRGATGGGGGPCAMVVGSVDDERGVDVGCRLEGGVEGELALTAEGLSAGWGAGGQVQVLEDLGGDLGVIDDGDEGHGALAARADQGLDAQDRAQP